MWFATIVVTWRDRVAYCVKSLERHPVIYVNINLILGRSHSWKEFCVFDQYYRRFLITHYCFQMFKIKVDISLWHNQIMWRQNNVKHSHKCRSHGDQNGIFFNSVRRTDRLSSSSVFHCEVLVTIVLLTVTRCCYIEISCWFSGNRHLVSPLWSHHYCCFVTTWHKNEVSWRFVTKKRPW